jgi:hypothetical protein
MPPENLRSDPGPLSFDALAGLLRDRARADVPCPECGPRCTTKANAKKQVLAVWRKGDGFLTYNCTRCGAKGYAAADRARDWRKATPAGFKPRHPPIVVPDADQVRRTKRARQMWREATNPRGTIVETYLASRGLQLDDEDDPNRQAIRYHGGLYLKETLHPDGAGSLMPGMLALMRDPVTDHPTGVHRTFLHRDGRPVIGPDGKKVRLMLGPANPIKIDAHEDVVSGLHIGEGIESVLAARQLGYRPAWAVGSAGAIAAFPVLDGIEALSVFTENDRASDDAARTLCARYQAAGVETWLCQPPVGDFNDVMREAA